MAIDYRYSVLVLCFPAFMRTKHQALAVSEPPMLCLSSPVTWREWASPNSLSVLGSFHIPSHRPCLSRTEPHAPAGLKMLRPDSVLLGGEDSEDTLLRLESQLCRHHLWNLGTVNWSFWTWRFIYCANKGTHLMGALSTSNELIRINAWNGAWCIVSL